MTPLPPWFFQKCVFFFRKRMKPWLLLTFNIIVGHIFPENFIIIPEIVQKIWNFSSSILTFFISFLDFLSFPCCKETNDISIFYFQPTLNRWLFNNCIKLYWDQIISSWTMKGRGRGAGGGFVDHRKKLVHGHFNCYNYDVGCGDYFWLYHTIWSMFSVFKHLNTFFAIKQCTINLK